MDHYEIRILPSPGFPTMVMAGVQLSDFEAIRSARKMARGRPFEVWKGLECVSGIAKLPELETR
jgi:hypothetical protein